MFGFRKKPPYSKRLVIEPPKPEPDRHGVAIASVVKNEASYAGEWAKYHMAVGVRQFFIYDDGSTDGTVEVLRSVLGDKLTVMPWKGRYTDVRSNLLLNSQAIAFAHAILNFGGAYRWMAFIDVDEFLLPKTGLTVDEALLGSGGFPNISLPWHMFGRGGHKNRPEGAVTRSYTSRARDPMSTKKNASNFKCIVDPCEVNEVSIHHFSTREHGEMTSNDAGAVFSRKGRKRPEFYSAQHLQLNHYYSKSDEELRAKLSRGPASPASRQRYEYRVTTAVQSIESEVVDDFAMVAFLDKIALKLD
jgi:hypothetical protein